VLSAKLPTVSVAAPSKVGFAGEPSTATARWIAEGLTRLFEQHGHPFPEQVDDAELVVNFTDAERPRPFRRRSQGTFVISVVEADSRPDDLLRFAYPLLVRSLSNLFLFVTPGEGGAEFNFVTLEQGYYTVRRGPSDEDFFAEVYRRIAPLASSKLVINNVFVEDLPAELHEGNERTEALQEAGARLDELDLLPAAFPIADLLDEREKQHVKRLFGIGGLSYGNLSVREDAASFWMSARGVDKGRLQGIGRDILLIRGFDVERHAMVVSVPPGIEPRSASVDAIEHWMLYSAYPGIGAIIHIHAWMEGIVSTTVNFPCGTYELAQEVAEKIRLQDDPTRAVVGLKNHGLTITGRSLDDIFERIEGKILRQIPME
jgi:ribulose-5-phosphate 4-epimerase/fuculose-1-phosphate aldolase